MPKYRKYNEVNIDKLTNLQNPDAVYWLGFLSADGGIVKNRLTLELSYRDIEHVYKFKKFMGAENPIRKITQSCGNKIFFSSKIDIYSKQLISQLAKFNIIQNKSLQLKFPKQIKNNKYVNRFIRGYIDGDGGIYRKNNKIKIYLTGTEDLLKNINTIIVNEALLPNDYINKPLYPDGNVFSLEYASTDVCKQILNWLYQDLESDKATFLERKWTKINDIVDFKQIDLRNKILNTKIGSTIKKELTKSQLENLYKKYKTITDVANFLGYDKKTITKYLKKYKIEYKLYVPRKKSKKISEKEIKKAFANIKSIRALSRKFKCSRTLIKARLQEYKLI